MKIFEMKTCVNNEINNKESIYIYSSIKLLKRNSRNNYNDELIIKNNGKYEFIYI
tara:strand:+ start:33 stop:197 length:165 start_codon:yes stop_codon:yes gene_type:complete